MPLLVFVHYLQTAFVDFLKDLLFAFVYGRCLLLSAKVNVGSIAKVITPKDILHEEEAALPYSNRLGKFEEVNDSVHRIEQVLGFCNSELVSVGLLILPRDPLIPLEILQNDFGLSEGPLIEPLVCYSVEAKLDPLILIAAERLDDILDG